MKDKKVWFIGFTSRLWLPVTIEGWLVTASLFLGVLFIGKINSVPGNTSLTLFQALPIVIEFICLLAVLHFVTRGHVDKRY